MNKVVIKNDYSVTYLVPQLNIKKLIKNYYIKEGRRHEGDFQNEDGDPKLYLQSDCTSLNRILTIKYELRNGSGSKEYDIKIDALPSNLGKGVNLFFICPVSGKRASILYYCFQSQMYVHRTAYPQRIYYPIQLESKQYRIFQTIAKYDNKLFMNVMKIFKKTYQGKSTHLQKRFESLISKRKILDRLLSNF